MKLNTNHLFNLAKLINKLKWFLFWNITIKQEGLLKLFLLKREIYMK